MRPDIDTYFLKMAQLVSTRGTCHRRKVGCVLVDKHNFVIATGYNGRPSGFPHCEGKNKCKGAISTSGQNLEQCEAIHAEQNALLQCKDTQNIVTAYVTAFPCVTCTKLLLNTSCKRIVYIEDYPGGQNLWIKSGRKLFKTNTIKETIKCKN